MQTHVFKRINEKHTKIVKYKEHKIAYKCEWPFTAFQVLDISIFWRSANLTFTNIYNILSVYTIKPYKATTLKSQIVNYRELYFLNVDKCVYHDLSFRTLTQIVKTSYTLLESKCNCRHFVPFSFYLKDDISICNVSFFMLNSD